MLISDGDRVAAEAGVADIKHEKQLVARMTGTRRTAAVFEMSVFISSFALGDVTRA